MELTFYGGAGGVTGSKFLFVPHDDTRVLLDCGTFQGLPDVRERNRSFSFRPETIQHVVLSHAHVDHCGMLPLLVKRGFSGNIFSTAATKAVAEHMLLDAAEIEVQDAAFRQKHHIGPPDAREPLFTPDDIAPVLKQFVTVPYARAGQGWQEITSTLRLKFYDAGHILGSAVSVLEYDVPGGVERLAYTGDVGPRAMPLLYDPEIPAESINTVLLESTYGAREHQPLDAAVERLQQLLRDLIARGGKIIIPAFSLGRTQLIIYLLHKLTDEGKIPRVPIYVDSPLATDITAVFRDHASEYDAETSLDFKGSDHGPLTFRNLKYLHSKRESQQLNTEPGPFIVIAASGMMTAGRVVHHLRHSLADARNAVIVTGYQAQGTLGRQILGGAKRVDLYGDSIPVRAQVHSFTEFSAHADHEQLAAYLAQWQGIERVFLVHGEPKQAETFRAQLKQAHPDWQVKYPSEGETARW